jgi:hypothetical protein
MAKTEALASAAQPVSNQSYQSLTMLVSKKSWSVGSFKVIVYSPWTETYTYQWAGKARETTAWRCMLVDAADATLYCMGEFKLTDENKSTFETHVKTHVQGAQLVLTDVCPVENSKTQYMGCSVRVNINMASTKLTAIFGSPSAVQPAPRTTVVQTKDVQPNQSFDLTAFILRRGAARKGGEGRKTFDVELADGSKDETSGKVQTIDLLIFAAESDIDGLLHFADKSVDKQDPVSFFNVTGSWDAGQNAYRFASARKGFSMTVADSPRALEMRANAAELYNLQDKAAVSQTQWTPTECFAAQAAIGITEPFRTADSSAEQPDHPATQGSEFPLMVTLDDCKSWVDSFIHTHANPTQRISEAIAILQKPKSRKRRSDLQALCKIWAVAQKDAAQKKRSLSEVASGIEETVVRDTNRLRKLHAHHGHVSSVHAALRTSASSAEHIPAEIQENQDWLQLENDAALGMILLPPNGRC